MRHPITGTDIAVGLIILFLFGVLVGMFIVMEVRDEGRRLEILEHRMRHIFNRLDEIAAIPTAEEADETEPSEDPDWWKKGIKRDE